MGIRKEEKKNLNQLKLLMSVFKLKANFIKHLQGLTHTREMTVSVPI